MAINITPEDAAQALSEIEASRAAFRAAIRARNGHHQLWLWGGVWVVMGLTAQIWGNAAVRWFWLFCVPPWILSLWMGRAQKSVLRAPIDRRFLGVLAALVGFGIFVWPSVLRLSLEDGKAMWAYCALICMQAYIVGGLWFDNCLLWVGLIATALILAGFLWFAPIFWIWAAVFGGGTLILSGFYIRFYKR
jgi:hypothetical protein